MSYRDLIQRELDRIGHIELPIGTDMEAISAAEKMPGARVIYNQHGEAVRVVREKNQCPKIP